MYSGYLFGGVAALGRWLRFSGGPWQIAGVIISSSSNRQSGFGTVELKACNTKSPGYLSSRGLIDYIGSSWTTANVSHATSGRPDIACESKCTTYESS